MYKVILDVVIRTSFMKKLIFNFDPDHGGSKFGIAAFSLKASPISLVLKAGIAAISENIHTVFSKASPIDPVFKFGVAVLSKDIILNSLLLALTPTSLLIFLNVFDLILIEAPFFLILRVPIFELILIEVLSFLVLRVPILDIVLIEVLLFLVL